MDRASEHDIGARVERDVASRERGAQVDACTRGDVDVAGIEGVPRFDEEVLAGPQVDQGVGGVQGGLDPQECRRIERNVAAVEGCQIGQEADQPLSSGHRQVATPYADVRRHRKPKHAGAAVDGDVARRATAVGVDRRDRRSRQDPQRRRSADADVSVRRNQVQAASEAVLRLPRHQRVGRDIEAAGSVLAEATLVPIEDRASAQGEQAAVVLQRGILGKDDGGGDQGHITDFDRNVPRSPTAVAVDRR